jgi:hypothetical protein
MKSEAKKSAEINSNATRALSTAFLISSRQSDPGFRCVIPQFKKTVALERFQVNLKSREIVSISMAVANEYLGAFAHLARHNRFSLTCSAFGFFAARSRFFNGDSSMRSIAISFARRQSLLNSQRFHNWRGEIAGVTRAFRSS